MAANHCTGSPTFNEVSSGAFSEWPENLPGLVCKTPPFGINSAPRFAQCCSGPVYNITSPTSPDSLAYPVTCATLCQIDPALGTFNDKYPYHWSDHFMCLTNGGTEPSEWEVVCDTITVRGEAAPTSFSHTPTGSWMTKSYDLDSMGFPVSSLVPAFSNSVSGITMTREESSATLAASTELSGMLSASVSLPISSPSASSMDRSSTATTPVTPTKAGLSPKESLKARQKEGFQVSEPTLKHLRKQLGIQLRTDCPLQQQQQRHGLEVLLTDELGIADAEGYGHQVLYHHHRRHDFHFLQHRVFEAAVGIKSGLRHPHM
ncbi:hypothetical protein PEBR_17384 [Penicillium brasilianum]|uniref:Uncharacterized protein n=1 Tax=Penicillium brasilianum TaxID=104259 RepID=A0A1S9RPE3_PENBI|nr:hypothetical protein PEBR_17384 [Penicillium brasilianum]